VAVAQPDDLGDLLSRMRKDDGVGAGLLDRVCVALVDHEVRRRREHAVSAEAAAKLRNQ
jgi:hypothetical protein